jgi:N-acyl amino acid synthase of PEP-CTERM/exosortase system
MSPAAVSHTSLARDFERSFEIKLADTDVLRNRVFQLRYQVFCKELGYDMTQVDGLEADAYDDRSLHCLLRHRASGHDTGCVRLVLPLADGGGLPFESFGLRYVDRQLLDWKKVDPKLCCEVSRLAVVSEFRRRLGEQAHADGVAEVDDPANSGPHRRFPFIAISLYHACTALILQRGYEWVFMVIEPRLQRHLGRYGLNLRQISPEFEYFGQRAAYLLTGAQLRSDVENWRPEWQQLYGNVHTQLLGHWPGTPDKIISGLA